MKTQSRTTQSFRIGDTVFFGDGQFKRWDAYQEQTHTDCRLHIGAVVFRRSVSSKRAQEFVEHLLDNYLTDADINILADSSLRTFAL